MVKLVATSVVRGSFQGESHGGVYLVDTDEITAFQTVDWNKMDIDWRGRGWDRGLRGITFFDDRVFIAASDELFVYTPKFELITSYKNQYLKHCHEIFRFRDHIFITSTGFDSIVIFDVPKEKFVSAVHIHTNGFQFVAKNYNPNGDNGPLQINKLHLNNVFCSDDGFYVSGLNTEALLSVKGPKIGVAVTLPSGVHNARPFRDGVLFNDTRSDAVRYVSREGQKAFHTPVFDPGALSHVGIDESNLARPDLAAAFAPFPTR
ncbi:MAG: hypothetical protein R3C58_03760 [Parvularculaceae bacterium]